MCVVWCRCVCVCVCVFDCLSGCVLPHHSAERVHKCGPALPPSGPVPSTNIGLTDRVPIRTIPEEAQIVIHLHFGEDFPQGDWYEHIQLGIHLELPKIDLENQLFRVLSAFAAVNSGR